MEKKFEIRASMVFQRILIANNGMAAAKFLHSMNAGRGKHGSRAHTQYFGMVSGDDMESNAAYIQQLDYIITVPRGPSSCNYGNLDLIVTSALAHNCDAVWPGWGHASENYLLAEALEKIGIAWIGPSSSSMRLLGDKIASLLQAQSVGVPCASWSGSESTTVSACGLTSRQHAETVCNDIGYPVMLKAANGGGGRGIRRVNHPSEVGMAYDQIRQEVRGDLVFAMKCIENCRHVEIQVLGDGKGRAIALSGRDCSVQRRHQKLIEEGPPPFITPTVMEAMETAAENLCASVQYKNAGTVEFLFDERSAEFFFLEVNTRLQVEHPVTELLFGINLPLLQVMIAEQGEGLELRNLPGLEDLHPNGHVVACRIVAEDPNNNWLPTGGEVFEIRTPSNDVSAFFYFSVSPGGRIHEFSDSQFGHVFVKGNDRERAIKELEIFLRETAITASVTTNIEFMLEHVLRGEFRDIGPPTTNWLDGKIRALQPIRKMSTELLTQNISTPLIGACAHLAMTASSSADQEVLRWIRKGHRAPHSPASFSNRISVGTMEIEFEAVRTGENELEIHFASNTVSVHAIEWSRLISGTDNCARAIMKLPGIPGSVLVTIVSIGSRRMRIKIGKSQTWTDFEIVQDESKLLAPLNGRLVRWMVTDGTLVHEGQKLCELEAMKMVTSVIAKSTGVISLRVQEGVSFIEGDVLAVFEGESTKAEVSIDDHMDDLVLQIQAMESKPDPNSAFRNIVNYLDGFITRSPPSLTSLTSAQIGHLLTQFLTHEQEGLQLIVPPDRHHDDAAKYLESLLTVPDHVALSVWRRRLALPTRTELVESLVAICSDDGLLKRLYSGLDESVHAPLLCAIEKRIEPALRRTMSLLSRPSSDENLRSDPRRVAAETGSFYIHDLPLMVEQAITQLWRNNAVDSMTRFDRLFPEHAAAGMVAWHAFLKTPEMHGRFREVIFIANDITVQAGTFSVQEDHVFLKASALARELGIPRIYIACNSGARLGLCAEIQNRLRVKWIDDTDPTKGFEYLYLSEADYTELVSRVDFIAKRSLCRSSNEFHYILSDVIGNPEAYLGVENLMWSGAIAGETSLAYQETFTLTYVTGRTVGIGAYLARLGQRIIQKVNSPILLTGYQALNKLIGSEVYRSNDEIGGVGVMFRNGVAHQVVDSDEAGVFAILKWLSYVPAKRGAELPVFQSVADPVDRELLTDVSQGGRMLVEGDDTIFDRNSFVEVQSAWARSVIVGRARLGGIPIGVILVETRQTHFYQPADPADPLSQSVARPQAGQVWFPDSAYKTAQAIQDFQHEQLPLMILANWRGFSGGQRDMFNEILKFGSYIVDALRKYTQPVFVYLPPKSELRGGAWVVVYSHINKDWIEMYADPTARGGVLEPSGTTEIKFRSKALMELMVRNLPDTEDRATKFQSMKPTLVQIANTYADMHDTPQRMLRKGAIKGIVEWKDCRKFFHKRLCERLNMH
jgi:biotin carboxylase/acetyl-CoA carboxylase carboxyltransferase component